jgi:hypothetical protein
MENTYYGGFWFLINLRAVNGGGGVFYPPDDVSFRI